MAGHGKAPANLGGRNGFTAAGLRFGIVVSEFNDFITSRLLAGAVSALNSAGAGKKQMEIIRVPGAFELPIAAKKMAATGRFDSIICVGCVLRGETSHYDYVASETARGIQLAQLDTGVPMGFCVLTCDTNEQAMARAGEKKDGSDNKGYEVGIGMIEMARLSRQLSSKVSRKSAAVSRPKKRRTR